MSNLSNPMISLSENAIKKIKSFKDKNLSLKVSVIHEGCAGFKYSFSLTSNTNDDDYVFKHEELEIVIDKGSIAFLQDAEIDYSENLTGSSFIVRNPNVMHYCKCGKSFSA